MAWQRIRATPALVCALCLASFALSVPMLGARHLWGDEAFSVWASAQPVYTLIAGLDAQPPLYHLALKLGRLLWGESEFAIRFVSVLCGVLLTPVAYRTARAITGSAASALFCAALIALSPMLAYYQQEARMYAIAALACGISMWVAALGQSGRHIGTLQWCAYVAASLTALYSHFYTVPILAVNTGILLFASLRGVARSRALAAWLAAHLAITIGFGTWFFGLQWGVLTTSMRGGGGASRSLPPPLIEVLDNVSRAAAGIAFGLRFEAWQPAAALIFFGVVIGGALQFWRSGKRAMVLACGAWIALSALFVFTTASRSGVVPDFNPRYVLFVLLPLALLGAGWAARKTARWVALSTLLAASVVGHVALSRPDWQKSRYAELAGVIRARGRAEDLTALLNSDQFPLIRYYGPLPGTIWQMDNAWWGANFRTQLDADFARAANGKPRVWLVKYGWAATPGLQSAVEQRLQTEGVRLYYGEFGDATLSLFERIAANSERSVLPRNIRLGAAIRLTGLRITSARFRAGDAIPFELIWRAEGKPEHDFTAFVHLRRADSGEQLAANDSAPAVPTSGWRAGQVITDTRGIQIPANAPPGDYHIVIGMYQYPSFERLPINGSPDTEIVLHTVVVEP